MSYQTNKYEVGTVLNYKGNTYSVLAAFNEYPELTEDHYRCLSSDDRQARLNAFYGMLSSQLNVDIRSLVIQGNEDRRFNLDACPEESYFRIIPTSNYGTAFTREGKELYRLDEPVNLITEYEEEDGRIFKGWFINDENAYTQQEWSFLADRDLYPEARYAESLYEITVNGMQHSLIEAAGGGGIYTITVTSDGDGWSVKNLPLPEWITIDAITGEEGETVVRISVAGNTSASARAATVVFYNNGNQNKEATLAIEQKVAPPPKPTVYISASCDFTGENCNVCVSATRLVTSPIIVALRGDGGLGRFSLTIPSGQSYICQTYNVPGDVVEIEGISPTEDNNYYYQA